VTTQGKIKAISISEARGIKKKNVPAAYLKEDFGVVGDAHAGSGHRQISMISEESILNYRAKGVEVSPGDFAENITITGIDFSLLKLNNRLALGGDVVLEITQIGKACDHKCRIFEEIGSCDMALKGAFARVIKGGSINVGEKAEILND
jgi:MOSC domain-containing protein YiiM